MATCDHHHIAREFRRLSHTTLYSSPLYLRFCAHNTQGTANLMFLFLFLFFSPLMFLTKFPDDALSLRLPEKIPRIFPLECCGQYVRWNQNVGRIFDDSPLLSLVLHQYFFIFFHILISIVVIDKPTFVIFRIIQKFIKKCFEALLYTHSLNKIY